MCAVRDALDVIGRLAHLFKLPVDSLRGLNGGLRVEFGCRGISSTLDQ